jgi:hypothetical protein
VRNIENTDFVVVGWLVGWFGLVDVAGDVAVVVWLLCCFSLFLFLVSLE